MTYRRNDVLKFFREVLLPKLQSEAENGRWQNISPNNFGISEYEEPISCGVVYNVDEVWEIYIGALAEYNGDETYYLSFEYEAVHYDTLPIECRRKLDSLSANFVSLIPNSLQETVSDSGEIFSYDNFIRVIISDFDQPDEAISDILIRLDAILEQFSNFEFKLPVSAPTLSKDMETAKASIENILGDKLQVIPQEETVNLKLKRGYFLTFDNW